MKARTKLIGARVDTAFADNLKKLAAKRHRTVSQVLRMLAEEWVAKQKAA